jgi:hypothetical protein
VGYLKSMSSAILTCAHSSSSSSSSEPRSTEVTACDSTMESEHLCIPD